MNYFSLIGLEKDFLKHVGMEIARKTSGVCIDEYDEREYPERRMVQEFSNPNARIMAEGAVRYVHTFGRIMPLIGKGIVITNGCFVDDMLNAKNFGMELEVWWKFMLQLKTMPLVDRCIVYCKKEIDPFNLNEYKFKKNIEDVFKFIKDEFSKSKGMRVKILEYNYDEHSVDKMSEDIIKLFVDNEVL